MPRKPRTPKPPDPDVEIFKLYEGQVELRFKESSHRTTVIDNGQTVKPGSVTTILGVLAKPGLVEWGVRCCADHIQNGLDELLKGSSFSIDAVFKLVATAREAHNVVKQEAADIGTAAHDWLEEYWKAVVNKSDLPEQPDPGPVRNCTEAALKWIAEHDVRPLFIERPFYSRKHKFTGKEDLAAIIDGRLSIVDYKSSPKLYPEVALQSSAYAAMYEEEFGQPVLDRWGVRLGKYDGEFETKKFSADECPQDFDSFLACLKIYERLKHLRRKPKADSWLEELDE